MKSVMLKIRKMFFVDKPCRISDNNILKESILQELLRQAYYSYNLAILISTLSAIALLSGIGLMFFGKISGASITTAASSITSISYIQFAKESKDELKKIIKYLER